MFIVVLGGGIDLKGNLPSHVYQRLDQAIKLYKTIPRSTIICSGQYSFLYNQLKQYPPLTEAEAMAQYLEKNSIPQNNILLEKKSKDTISNAYYLKKDIFIPNKQRSAIIITSHFHLQRVKYIFNKIFGLKYKLKFISLKEHLNKNEEKRVIKHQKQLLTIIKKILSPIRSGNHSFLDGKFYKIDYYRQKRPDWVIKFVAEGK